jgi:hypothetical protein
MKRFLELSDILAVGLLAAFVARAAEPPLGSEYRVGGFVVGCQAYMFHRFTAFEAIEKTVAAGGKVIGIHRRRALRHAGSSAGALLGHL